MTRASAHGLRFWRGFGRVATTECHTLTHCSAKIWACGCSGNCRHLLLQQIFRQIMDCQTGNCNGLYARTLKPALSLRALCLLLLSALVLTACRRQNDDEVRRDLPGTWVVEGDSVFGGHFKSTSKIDDQGNYFCQLLSRNGSDALIRTSNIAGTFQVKDGMLIDTILKHSNTNAALPIISKARILRVDADTMVIRYEPSDGFAAPTNDVVFRKQR
jgi:hypothetical protein